LQYGDCLIVMNCSEDKELAVSVPPDFADGRDLIGGKSAHDLTTLPPHSTAVLWRTAP
jgi:hypothetical protein